MKRSRIKELLQSDAIGTEVSIKGWVRTKRGSKNVAFLAMNDGSTINNIQAVVDFEKISDKLLDRIHTGASLHIIGELMESQGKGQKVEVAATSIEIYGEANPDEYPLQAKKHSLEFLREIAHLRFRTNTFSAITRIRHNLIFAIHQFFTEKGFVNIHTPIITASDAEGAGEMFQVTNLDPQNLPLKDDGTIDWKEDFFGRKTNLTVSGQLEGELAAMGLGEIYTFGPTFRAENSNTTRHLAEFWMIEPEMAFYDIHDNADLAEELLKYVIQYILDHSDDDLSFLSQRLINEEKGLKKELQSEFELKEKLKFVLDNDFIRITYTEAFDILRNSKANKKKKFKYLVKDWGFDMQSEHERYLVEKHFKKPVVVTDYPKGIKSFYMKQNEDGKTVRAMDILFPQIGEMVGGSQREESYELLTKRMEEMGVPQEELWWYLETRKFGTVPHSGFGLGFERLMLFVTGMKNIRDVIAFPRTPKNAEF